MGGQASIASQEAIQEYRRESYLISTDPVRLDVGAIHAFLSRSFRETEGISRETLMQSIRGSLCFGVYDGSEQVGFARVVTDGATYAYICDDYILESHRGRGLAKWLMECILGHPAFKGLRRWGLITRDVRLYAKFGFAQPQAPETYLELANPEACRTNNPKRN